VFSIFDESGFCINDKFVPFDNTTTVKLQVNIMRVLSNDMKSPRRHSSFSPPASCTPITSPQTAPSVPKWKATLKERNRLAAPPLVHMESPRPIAGEDMSAEEKIIWEEYNPLFDSMTDIEYTPDEDDDAAQVFGRESNWDVKMKRKSAPASTLRRHVEKQTSGYNFDELLGE
jgi:hypothetical protein